MKCPFCLCEKSKVYNSRATKNSTTKWRRRRCLECNNVYTTQETCDLYSIWRVKKTNSLLPYSKLKLLFSIMRSCDHKINNDKISLYITEIAEEDLYCVSAKTSCIITNTDISQAVLKALMSFDKIAYIKYASHHNLPICDKII